MAEIFRIVGGGLIALVASYIGLIIKRRYKTREQFFSDVREYFALFENELTYEKTSVPEINKKFLNGKNGEFANWLQTKNKTIEQTSKRQLTFLKENEREQIDSALSGLGKSGYQEQLAYVKKWQMLFKDKHDKCAMENKKYGGMYFKLCVLAGIAILILLA